VSSTRAYTDKLIVHLRSDDQHSHGQPAQPHASAGRAAAAFDAGLDQDENFTLTLELELLIARDHAEAITLNDANRLRDLSDARPAARPDLRPAHHTHGPWPRAR
jgi:hypothetical protein